MAEIISANYYQAIMKRIRQAIAENAFEHIMWFGDCHMVSLIYDYLAADGHLITAVIDNDPSKQGQVIERNWCMPFTFGYTKTDKEQVDLLVAGRTFPSLRIIAPGRIFHYTQNIRQILFFTSSYRSHEMRRQLLSMGADPCKIIELPTEQELWEDACRHVHSLTESKRQMEPAEHKETLLSILAEFAGYCEANHLRYYLAYGTLIGAVRHKGFIPWDDDIDILMPAEDYGKFIRQYRGNGKYEVLDYTTNDDYFFPFAKLTDNGTYLHHFGCPITWMQGTYIDLFPMSGFENGICFEEQWKHHTLLDVKWYWYYLSKGITSHAVKDCRSEILMEKHKIGFDHADYVGVLTTIPAKPWMLRKEIFADVCKLPFEGRLYNAPLDYDRYLRGVYGDYMKLPPEEEQRIHGFPSYRRMTGK